MLRMFRPAWFFHCFCRLPGCFRLRASQRGWCAVAHPVTADDSLKKGMCDHELNHFYVLGFMILVLGDVFSFLHGSGIHSIFWDQVCLQFSYLAFHSPSFSVGMNFSRPEIQIYYMAKVSKGQTIFFKTIWIFYKNWFCLFFIKRKGYFIPWFFHPIRFSIRLGLFWDSLFSISKLLFAVIVKDNLSKIQKR